MEGLPDYDDLVENNEYVRQRFLACHDRLVVILWGSFQKAISDLSLLYKEKLDDQECHQHYLIQALSRISHFHSMSQKALQLVDVFGNDLGNDVGRLLLRDFFLSSSHPVTPLQVYEIILSPFARNRKLKRSRRSCGELCKKCNKLKNRKSKRRRVISEAPHKTLIQNQSHPIRSFDFSSVPSDRQGNFTISLPQIAPVSSPIVYVPPSNEDKYKYSYSQSGSPARSKYKRLFRELSDYDDSGLTDSISMEYLHHLVKRPRHELMFDDDQ